MGDRPSLRYLASGYRRFLEEQETRCQERAAYADRDREMPVGARHDLRQEPYRKCGDCMQTSRAQHDDAEQHGQYRLESAS